MKRAEAEKLLVDAGASLGGSVTKKTDLLIYGNNAGSKLSKAQSLGVATMTEQEMVAQLTQGAGDQGALGEASEKLAAAAKEEAKKMRSVRKLIDAANAPYLEKYGATLGHLLLKYLHAFALRPDVFIYDERLGRPASNASLLREEKQAPAEYLALASELSELEWNWTFTEDKDQRQNYSKGYNGGRINLQSLEKLRWYPRQEWWDEDFDGQYYGGFDDLVNEGLTFIGYKKKQRPANAQLFFDNANDCTQTWLGGIFDYFQEGAKLGFTWYWPAGTREGFTEKLFQSSLPKNTPHEVIIEKLVEKGLSEADATALSKWLGKDVVILLHSSEIPEADEASKRAKRFPLSEQTSSRSMDLATIEQLTQASDPMDKIEWKLMLEDHKTFLEHGGAGGNWQLLSVSGLPLCMYTGVNATDGTQAVLRLKNISGINAKGENLSYADLSGCNAKEANFSKADLSHSVLTDSLFQNANFEGAKLEGVDFSGSNLKGANFRKADLTGADFECADLTGADFSGAKLKKSRFPGAKLDNIVDKPAKKKK